MATLAGMQRGWTMMPGRFPAIYSQKSAKATDTSPATFKTFHPRDCWRRNYETKEAEPSLGAYQVTTQDIGIPKEQLSLTPKPSDIVTFANETWTVLSIGEWGAQGSWKLNCLKMGIDSILGDLVSLYRPVSTRTDSGIRTTANRTLVAENVPCKIQTVDSLSIVPIQAEGRLGKWMMPSPYKCYLAFNVDVNAQDIAVDQHGNEYTLLNVTNPDKLDALPGIDLMRLP